jgi:hypothetical protein
LRWWERGAPRHRPVGAVSGPPPPGANDVSRAVPRRALRELERRAIVRALEDCWVDRTRAAQLLDIDPSTLRRRIRETQIESGDRVGSGSASHAECKHHADERDEVVREPHLLRVDAMKDDARRPRGKARSPRAPLSPGTRQILMLVLGLALTAVVYLSASGRSAGPFLSLIPGLGPPPIVLDDDSFIAQRKQITPLTSHDEKQLRAQRAKVDELARRHVGTTLTGGASPDDLRILQEILDKKVLSQDQTWELQALGVALGDVMAEQLGLTWVVLEDRLGRSRVLRFRESENLVFPVTMISKRVEGNVRFRVQELFEKTANEVDDFALNAPGRRRRQL